MKSTTKIAAIFAMAIAFAFPAFGQAQGQQQDQTTNTKSVSGASNQGNNQGITINNPAAPSDTRAKIDTTATVVPPSIGNASGTYNCFGSASAGVGWTGFGISGGSTTSQVECYRNHLMDKAANRVAAGDKTFIPVWDALFCMFEDGATAYASSGKVCPQEEAARRQQAAVVQQNTQRIVTNGYTGPLNAAQADYVAKGGNDPIALQRMAGK